MFAAEVVTICDHLRKSLESGGHCQGGRSAAIRVIVYGRVGAARADQDLSHDLGADASGIVGVLLASVFSELVGLGAAGVLPPSRLNDFSAGRSVGGDDLSTNLASVHSLQPVWNGSRVG